MALVSRTVPDRAALGAALRAFRKRKDITQEQLSFRSGLTTALISDTENGKRNLSFESIGKLLVALEADWEELGRALVREAKKAR